MKVAVVNEISSCAKNKDIVNALSMQPGIEVLNIGMQNPTEENPLTYIQTGIITAIVLNYQICDMVIGGCGTGQGYLNAVMQFPNVCCGLIQEPLDAWLFSQINGGNCISLALNKGYGWAADINLTYIFEKLFKDPVGKGYPLERQESQKESREILRKISKSAHKDFIEIMQLIDAEVMRGIRKREDFMEILKVQGKQNMDLQKLVDYLLAL